MGALKDNPKLGHITTFGGHPVSCAAALATLQTLVENPQIIESVEGKSPIPKKVTAFQSKRNKGQRLDALLRAGRCSIL